MQWLFSSFFRKAPDKRMVAVAGQSVRAGEMRAMAYKYHITDGSEFLDDRIRMKEQPLVIAYAETGKGFSDPEKEC